MSKVNKEVRSLSTFISKTTYKNLPFFKILKVTKQLKKLLVIQIHPMDDSITTKIGDLLLDSERVRFENCLKDNVNVFAWLHDEMPR